MSNFLRYKADKDRVVVYSKYNGTVSQIEKFIRQEKASGLEVNYGTSLCRFPCVTFITRLRIWDVVMWDEKIISSAISSMILLEKITIRFSDSYGSKKKNSICDAVANHPSIRVVDVRDPHKHGFDEILDKNMRITDYKFGMNKEREYGCGDKLAKLTHIKRLGYFCLDSAFRSGDFARFAKNNPGIEELLTTVSRSSEFVAAAQYFTNLSGLCIDCVVCNDADALKNAVAAILMRCHLQYLRINIGDSVFIRKSNIPYGCYNIDRRVPPRWNFLRSALVYDIRVHTHND